MNLEPFRKLKGRDVIELGKERFLAITPAYTGDILWEHVDILQKGKQLTTSWPLDQAPDTAQLSTIYNHKSNVV